MHRGAARPRSRLRSLRARALAAPGLALLLLALALVAPASPLQDPWRGPPPPREPGEAVPEGGVVLVMKEPTDPERDQCLAALTEELPDVIDLADLSRGLEVNRTRTQEVDLNETTAILLSALGWRAGIHGEITDVQDRTEVEVLTCRFRQRVNLEEENVLSALALEGPTRDRLRPTHVANLSLDLTVVTTKTQRFRLDEDTVLSAISLSPGGFDPGRVEDIATLSRDSRTDRHFTRIIDIDTNTVILALGGAGRPHSTR